MTLTRSASLPQHSPYPFSLQLALWLAGLMFSLPFLLPVHRLPLPAFHSEWLAMSLGVLACIPLLLAQSALTVPRLVMAPLGWLLVVLLQWGLGMFAYGASALLIAGYLLWAALMLVLGRTLAARMELAQLYAFLAWSLLLSGLLGATAGLLQYAQWWPATGGLVIEPMALNEFGVYGNLAQQNHFATHLALALASGGYLWLAGRLARGWLVAPSVLLLAALVLSGSRSSFLYVLLLAGLMLWQRQSLSAADVAVHGLVAGQGGVAGSAAMGRVGFPRRVLRPAFFLCLLLVLGLMGALALHFAPHIPQLQRLTTLSGAIGVRGFLWQHALAMFMEKPLLGAGFDAFGWKLVEQLYAARELNKWGIDQHAHNLPLQVLAWSGMAGALALGWPFWRFFQRQRRLAMSLPRRWLCAICGILLIHSLLEQPLFFAYFLGVLALLLGSADTGEWHWPLRRIGRAAVALGLVFALGVLLKTAIDFERLDRLVYTVRHDDPDTVPGSLQRQQAMRDLQAGSLLAPLAEFASPADFVAVDAPVADKIAFNLRVMHFAPVAEIEFRHAVLLTEAGRLAEAKQQLQRAVLAWPTEGEAYLARFNALAESDPVMYGELAHYANQLFAQLLSKEKNQLPVKAQAR